MGLLPEMQLLGLALEDERGQVGIQDKRSAWVLGRKTSRHILGPIGTSLSLTYSYMLERNVC